MRGGWLAGEFLQIEALLRSRLQRALQRANTPYLPHERFQILKLRSEAGLSVSATAQFFLLCHSTISRWCAQARKDPCSESIGSLLTPIPPSTRYCDAFRSVVQFLAALNLRGTGQIAAFLCSAGLEVSRSTVRRILREPLSKPATTPPSGSQAPENKHRVVTAREPLHVVMADITEFPAAFRQPSFKLAAFYDAFSRTPLVWGLFRKNPSGRDIAELFNRLSRSFRTPRHLVTDQGRCFTSRTFKKALKRKGTKQRFGAIGKHGSIALIERFYADVGIIRGGVRRERLRNGSTPPEVVDNARPLRKARSLSAGRNLVAAMSGGFSRPSARCFISMSASM